LKEEADCQQQKDDPADHKDGAVYPITSHCPALKVGVPADDILSESKGGGQLCPEAARCRVQLNMRRASHCPSYNPSRHTVLFPKATDQRDQYAVPTTPAGAVL
jgi:hypothetical protein